MSEQDTQLLVRIEERREDLAAYLGNARPRVERLALASVISSALAAALTAGPALGGETLTSTVGDALGVRDSLVWRVLCLLALLVSIVAAVTANLMKSRHAEERIVSAEACLAELDGLRTMLEFGQLPLPEAVKLYQQYVAKVPFVTDHTPTRAAKT